MNEQNRLAKKLKKPGIDLRLRRATIVSVGSGTATVHYAGTDIPDVPFYTHVTGLTTGDTVDIMFDGESPVIVGKFA